MEVSLSKIAEFQVGAVLKQNFIISGYFLINGPPAYVS